MKIYNKKKLLIIIALLIPTLFIGTYYFLSNNSNMIYMYNIKYNIKHINKINKEVSSYIRNDTINIKDSKKFLPKYISNLSNIYNKLVSLDPPYKCTKYHNYLLSGINNNIHIYEQILSIINNPKDNNLEKCSLALKKYTDNCTHYYSLCSIKPFSNKDNLDYITKYITYANKLNQLHKNKDIAQSQYKEYINDMDEIVTTFLKIKSDFSHYNNKIKNNSISHEDILKNIDDKNSQLTILMNKFSKITVPSQGVDCYKLLFSTLDNYKSYIQNFRYALSKDSSKHIDDFNQLYEEANSNYKIMNSNYNKFVKSYYNFKNLSKS